MKIKRKIIAVLMSVVLSITMCSCVGISGETSLKAEYTLTVAVAIAENTPSGEALLAIKDELERRSDGKVTLDIFWESTLGGATEISENVKMGTVDIGLLSSAIIANYAPTIDVLSLPFMISSRDQMKVIYELYFDEITADIRDSLGVPLGIWEFGYRHLCTKDVEVTSVEDCKGLTIRVMDGQMYSDTFNALGCIPSNIAHSELVPALQQGTVDGAEEPMAMVCNQQQYTFCDYVAMIGYNYSVGCPIMSTSTYNNLPDDVRDLVEEVFYEYRYYTIDLGQKYEDEYIKICQEGGMTINYISDEEMKRFQEAVEPVWENYSERMGEDLVQKIANASK